MLQRLNPRESFVALLLIVVMTLMLGMQQGCASAPPIDTFNKKMAVTVASNTAVRDTATTLLVAKKISVPDAQNVLAQTDLLRDGLNVARGMSSTDLASAEGRLEAASAAIKGLQDYLIKKQGAAK